MHVLLFTLMRNRFVNPILVLSGKICQLKQGEKNDSKYLFLFNGTAPSAKIDLKKTSNISLYSPKS